jgi:hypothetical protein
MALAVLEGFSWGVSGLDMALSKKYHHQFGALTNISRPLMYFFPSLR